jgi:tetratricopeptide (TPR) repeat protein
MIRCLSAILVSVLGTAVVPPPTCAQEPFPTRVDGPSSPLPLSAVHRTDIAAAIRAEQWDRATRLLADEINRQPHSRELLILIARIFFLDGKPLNTAVALKKADAIAPLEREPRFMLVLAYIRIGRGEWARPELERLVKSVPDNAEYRYWLGRLDYDEGKYAAAISRFKDVLATNPQFIRAHDNLGLCYEALDEADLAIAHYREAIRLNRQARAKSSWPATNLAILLRQRGELEEADSLFREALRYDRGFATAHYQLGILLEQQGRLDEAVAELRLATAIEPSKAEPHYVLSRIYRRQGQTAQADEALAAFLRLRAPADQRHR